MNALFAIAWALAGAPGLAAPGSLPAVQALVPCDPQGRTVLDLAYDREGKVVEARVVRSSGDAGLDRSAAKSALAWKLSPATRDGRPVAGRVQVPVVFDGGTRRAPERACAPSRERARKP